MNRKKVFLIRNVGARSFGGGEVYQLDLAGELLRAGFEPVILSNSRELLKRAKKAGYLTLIPPYIHKQDWSGKRNLLLPLYWFRIMRMRRWYDRAFRKWQPGVVNIQSRDEMLAVTPLAHNLGIKVLWTDHADFKNWVLWNVNRKYKNILGKIILRMARLADRVIFVSESLREETEKMIAPKIIPHAIAISNGVVDVKGKYDEVLPSRHSLIYVGRLVEEKGINELVKAFSIVVEKYPDAKLNLYGEGQMSIGAGVRNVKIHRSVENVPEVLAQNAVFVLPSHREGMSLALLEAMMMGKIIVATDIPGNKQLISNKKTGLVVRVNSNGELVHAIEWIFEHESEATRFARNARSEYLKKYNLDDIFRKELLVLYEDK